MYIGSHVSYKGKEGLVSSVKETIRYNANTFMIYTGAPQNTVRSKIDQNNVLLALKMMKENNISNIIAHAPYIINLANNKDKEKQLFMINFLKEELNRCQQLKINKIVMHPGSHIGLGEEEGIKNIINGLNMILEGDGPIICLETMAGKGTEIGYTFQHLNKIIKGIKNKKRIMICLDTCHMHDAGYDLSNFDNILKQLEENELSNKIACIHINDSKNKKGSKKDRHENIGYGQIGFTNLINIIYHPKLKGIPKILETPYYNKKPLYKYEIEMIKNKKFNKDLYKISN